ncbi:TPR domain protein, putative component of TonB system [Thioalkalivibrio nitratireducens DSM 14787]|uniref:TPR domain protein, putative component of TonB system n=1 Tax=Thioalkalivibrio nitratireducens (strain DSM 14787 / UNIQEM 213 / ALEN2) TaxID=1255043 RepID=L0DTZ0_THIND|nr:TPR domain protein, putative component of TonB system [Thioalkalivibrio nitratireducens DSM 14787]
MELRSRVEDPERRAANGSRQSPNSGELLSLVALPRQHAEELLATLQPASEPAIQVRVLSELLGEYVQGSQLFTELGRMLIQQGRPVTALAYLDEAVRRHRNSVAALRLRAYALIKIVGEMHKAVLAHQEALAIKRDSKIERRMLMAMHYATEFSPEDIAQEHFDWGDRHGFLKGPAIGTRKPSDDPRRLRVGYVSADFRNHSAASFLRPILENHDRTRFEVIGYAANAKQDSVTDELKRLCDRWREIHGLATQEVVEAIRKDCVDILVDLAGHTSGNRLDVFIRRAAPLQVTYLGYPNGTGIRSMDCRVTDAVTDPPGASDRLYRERLLRIDPVFLCYQPPRLAIPVGPPPAASAGFVTFGTFNNYAKISREVIAVWARILAAVPDSRLLIKSTGLDSSETRTRLMSLFEAAGLSNPGARIDLMNRVRSTEEHLRIYDRVDLALDTFPYSGTTTTCQALWMGVPVLTLYGRSHVGRVSASVLRQMALDDLVAGSEEDYIARAGQLGREPARLAALRGQMRPRLLASPLCDAHGFVRKLESLFLGAWRQVTEPHSREHDAQGEAPPRRLQIGGTRPAPGWEIFNIAPAEGVDHVGNAKDLSRFPDRTFTELYASHVLEHFSYSQELEQVLNEWYRVMKEGGRLRISVPDLEVLSAMFLDRKLSSNERFFVMRMIFGGQVNPCDFHRTGFSRAFLVHWLRKVGFSEIRQVKRFGLFADNSNKIRNGKRISLNVMAVKRGAS